MPLYNNFTDAFGDFLGQYSNLRSRIDDLDTFKLEMMDSAIQGNWLNAFSGVCSIVNTIRTMWLVGLDMSHANWAYNHFFRSIFWARYEVGNGEPYTLTLRDVLDVMNSASNDELKEFIGLVDAYRQSLWNKPFNVEYWAAIARGFEIWG